MELTQVSNGPGLQSQFVAVLAIRYLASLSLDPAAHSAGPETHLESMSLLCRLLATAAGGKGPQGECWGAKLRV